MQIIHNLSQNNFPSLNTIRGGKNESGILQDSEKELLEQVAEAFTVVYGGHIKGKRRSA